MLKLNKWNWLKVQFICFRLSFYFMQRADDKTFVTIEMYIGVGRQIAASKIQMRL